MSKSKTTETKKSKQRDRWKLQINGVNSTVKAKYSY